MYKVLGLIISSGRGGRIHFGRQSLEQAFLFLTEVLQTPTDRLFHMPPAGRFKPRHSSPCSYIQQKLTWATLLIISVCKDYTLILFSLKPPLHQLFSLNILQSWLKMKPTPSEIPQQTSEISFSIYFCSQMFPSL